MAPNGPNLSDDERKLLVQWLLQNNHCGSLRYGAQLQACALFQKSRRTINRVWKSVAQQQSLGLAVNVVGMKKGKIQSNRKELDEEKMKNLPFLKRSSIRKLAGNLKVSVGLAHRWVKLKKISAHSSAIKPFLTEANKLHRLKWCLSMLSCISQNGKIAFQSMFNIIHIDEKWFNLTRTSSRYYLVKGEEQPHRTCKSKAHIDKIMFLSVVGRPHYDEEGNEIFDGKFGIFPFIFKEPAARNSKNRAKGTIITKPTQVISRDVMRRSFLQQAIPCIKQKWPEGVSKNIIIQQDNAKPHITDNDPEFQAIAHTDGFNIKLLCQPPNSPDTNVNDLGFFRSIQSLKDEKNAITVEDLIKNVTEAFEEYPSYKLNDVFLTLQQCYEEIIKVKGGNNYDIPHIGKGRLRREGRLPTCIEVDEQLVADSLEYLNLQGSEGYGPVTIESLVNGIEQVGLGVVHRQYVLQQVYRDKHKKLVFDVWNVNVPVGAVF